MWKWFQYDTLLEILALMSFDGPNQILSIFRHLVSFDGPKNLISFDGPTFFSPPKPHVFWRTQKPHVFGWTLDLLSFGGPKVPIIFIITFFSSFSEVCPTSSDTNYRAFNSKCYYFESSPATYNDAQTACNSKIGTGGKLAEPSASVELYAFLYSTASSIVNNSGPYWIGIDDLQNNDGVFRYASTLSGRLWSF